MTVDNPADRLPEPQALSLEAAAVASKHGLMRWATYMAVLAAAVLVAVKVGAWLMTDSVAMLSSLVDSMLDGVASLVNLIAVRHALQPADAEHRFGHGKAEPLAGLAQAAFVTGSGLLLTIEAVSRLLNPVVVKQGMVGIGVMVFSIVVTMALVTFQRHVIKRTNSVAITADSLHYAGDVLINLSVIVSILISVYLGWIYADPIFGLAIAAFLLFNAWKIARESLDLLMDREFDAADRQKILDIARAHPRVEDVHDLRTRSSGQLSFIQLHLEMDRSFTLLKAHAVADRVERDIRKAFPNADVIIHQDPSGLREAHHDDLAYEDRENGVPDEPLPKA
ncbi:MAG: cation diffusion facilitator family transporter [Rhodospirillaceae bacterium]